MYSINSFIKLIVINSCVIYSYFKLINCNKTTKLQKIKLSISILFLSIFQCFLQNNTPFLFRYFIIYFLFSIILGKSSKSPLLNSTISTILSYTLTYIANFISLFAVLILEKYNMFNLHFTDTTRIAISSIITLVLIYLFFKIKRFKNGFPFSKQVESNSPSDIYILVINSIIILMYFFIGNFYNISIIYMFVCFIFFSIVMFIIIQKTFTFYQKQKLQTKALKDYEQELAELKSKLQIALSEKEQIIKSNHEFYHRQKALSKKLDILLNSTTSMNTEFGEDLSDIQKRISKLSAEYNAKVSIIPNIEKTNITEIDDMLVYMQSECNTNNIEFNLKINCDMNDILTKFITSSQLETLLGDLIRNSIIAINHSSNNYRSILIVFGIKDGIYEISLWDSGIPFEIDTLVNLGINRASTHLDEGGTGIGFITTFETINSCNASFIINEVTGNNYTKCLSIRFDNKHDYVIISDRIEDIQQHNTINRKIILKKQE